MMTRKEAGQIILGNLCLAVNKLQSCREFALLMPEVRVNIVYAMPGAKDGKDVAAIDGRITIVNGYPFASGIPVWGGSDHMARLVIEARKFDKSISAGINFKCDEEIINVVREYAKDYRRLFGWIDRTHEPDEVSRIDGSSMPWIVSQLVEQSGRVPDVFYEGDGWGKEPLFFMVGGDAISVVDEAVRIARLYSKSMRKRLSHT